MLWDLCHFYLQRARGSETRYCAVSASHKICALNYSKDELVFEAAGVRNWTRPIKLSRKAAFKTFSDMVHWVRRKRSTRKHESLCLPFYSRSLICRVFRTWKMWRRCFCANIEVKPRTSRRNNQSNIFLSASFNIVNSHKHVIKSI